MSRITRPFISINNLRILHTHFCPVNEAYVVLQRCSSFFDCSCIINKANLSTMPYHHCLVANWWTRVQQAAIGSRTCPVRSVTSHQQSASVILTSGTWNLNSMSIWLSNKKFRVKEEEERTCHVLRNKIVTLASAALEHCSSWGFLLFCRNLTN